MKARWFLIPLLAIANLFGCNGDTTSPSPDSGPKAQYRKISPDQAKQQLDADKNIILLDVRTEAEHRNQRIPGSILIPLNQLTALAPVKLPNKESKIFVYCHSGNRSKSASKKLISLGYQNIHDLGGIIDWKYATESGR